MISNKFNRSLPLLLLFLPFSAKAQQSLDSVYEASAKLRHEHSEEVLQQMKESDFEVTYRPILLREMVETGLRKNFDQTIRELNSSVLELNMEDAHNSFWYPRLKIDLNSGPHPIVDLTKWESQANTPAGYLGIGFDSYTLFNWGKDYLSYLNNKTVYKRGNQTIIEDRRQFRHNMIIAFFNLWQVHEIEKIQKDNLRQTSFLYKLNHQKVALKKIRIEEYYQARSEYLRSQQNYQQAKLDVEMADEEISYLLNSTVGTRYTLKETLFYQELNDKFIDLLQYALEKNSTILNAASELEISSRAYKIALKENMPLPKFTATLGGYSHLSGSGMNSSTYNANELAGNNNVDLVAAINASWTIWGVNGFLNRRLQERAQINKNISEKKLEYAKLKASSLTRQLYRKIINYEDQIKILAAATATNEKLVDEILDSYMNEKARFLDFKCALESATTDKINFIQKKFLHLKNKILLAEEVGLDDIPGKNFEELAITAEDENL